MLPFYNLFYFVVVAEFYNFLSNVVALKVSLYDYKLILIVQPTFSAELDRQRC